MAWLSGLAGKAEEVLNNIDKSTAKVLKKDDNKSEQPLLEVMSVSDEPNKLYDDKISSYDNRSNLKPLSNKKIGKMALSAPVTPTRCKSPNLEAESLAWLNKTTSTSFENKDFQMLNFESNTNHYNNDDIIDKSDGNHDYKNLLIVESLQTNKDDINIDNLKNMLEKNDSKMEEKSNDSEYLREIETLKEKVNLYSTEKTRLMREITELSSTLEKTRSDLNSVESELEQHRARALKTLQERDKLIAELRNNSSSEFDDTSVLVELNQLRQEREVLREENRHVREKLRQARQESIDADLNAEKVRQNAMESSIQARETVANERRKRLEAEEESKLRNEEVRSLREELTLRHNAFSAKLQKQESEISRLRSQLSAAVTPNSEVESRLANLTRTLVLKQQDLENLTTERNALKLQFEKLEHEFQNWRKNYNYNSVNDTDDDKALLPSFLMENPFDTGVTRRVKRAYSTLDAVGIRIGVFLRRYPLARIFVILYMALLQFWVIVVLFSQSPEAH